jgi:hypothetical protein
MSKMRQIGLNRDVKERYQKISTDSDEGSGG